jgi:hypothetical protein
VIAFLVPFGTFESREHFARIANSKKRFFDA